MAISHSSRYNIFFQLYSLSSSLRTFLRVHTTYFHGEIKKYWSCTVSDQPVHCNTSLPCETVKSTVWVREDGAFTKHRTSLARFFGHVVKFWYMGSWSRAGPSLSACDVWLILIYCVEFLIKLH